MKRTVIVEGMACPRCEARVKAALEAVSGVVECEVSHITGRAEVTLNTGITDAELMDAVNQLGKFKAVSVE